jgi:hypothetical protein
LAFPDRSPELKKTAFSVDSDGKGIFFECRVVLISPRHVQKNSREDPLSSPAWQQFNFLSFNEHKRSHGQRRGWKFAPSLQNLLREIQLLQHGLALHV